MSSGGVLVEHVSEKIARTDLRILPGEDSSISITFWFWFWSSSFAACPQNHHNFFSAWNRNHHLQKTYILRSFQSNHPKQFYTMMILNNKFNTMDFQLSENQGIDSKSQRSQSERINADESKITADNDKRRSGSPVDDTNNMFTKVRYLIAQLSSLHLTPQG